MVQPPCPTLGVVGGFFHTDQSDQAHLSQNGDILLKCTLQTYSCSPASFLAKGKCQQVTRKVLRIRHILDSTPHRYTSQGATALGFGGESSWQHPGDTGTSTGTSTTFTGQDTCGQVRSPEWTAESGLLLQEVRPGGTYKIHLLTTENKAVGCGWQPSIDKAQDLNPLDHRSEPHCYQECARCFRLFGFPTDWPVDSQQAEEDSTQLLKPTN